MKQLTDEQRDKVLNLVDDLREDIIADTAKILSFRTISSSRGKLDDETQLEFKKAFEFVELLCERMGLKFRMLDGRVGIAELPPPAEDAETIGVLLHIDVMPPGETEWKYPPYEGVVAEDKIWGRGAQDDKGPLIATMYGLWVAMQAAGQGNLKRGCTFIIGTQEEAGDWSDIHHYKQVEKTPDFCIVPDAEFPIIVAEKGMVNVKVSKTWSQKPYSDECGVSLEEIKAGQRANMVPDRAVLRLVAERPDVEQYIQDKLAAFRNTSPEAGIDIKVEEKNITIEITGKPAHGSRPFDGHNAAVDALNFLASLNMKPVEFQEFLTFSARGGEGIWGETLGIESEHPFVGKTTVCLGVLKVDGAEGEVTYNIRNTFGLSVDDVEKGMRKVIDQLKADTDIVFDMKKTSSGTEPLFVDPEEFVSYIEPMKYAYETVTGKKAELKAIGGTTYAKAIPRAVSFGPVLLDEENEMAHQVNEHVAVEHQLRNVKIYSLALRGLIAD
jgi:succinyl-diaminopimelate desuccinylase